MFEKPPSTLAFPFFCQAACHRARNRVYFSLKEPRIEQKAPISANPISSAPTAAATLPAVPLPAAQILAAQTDARTCLSLAVPDAVGTSGTALNIGLPCPMRTDSAAGISGEGAGPSSLHAADLSSAAEDGRGSGVLRQELLQVEQTPQVCAGVAQLQHAMSRCNLLPHVLGMEFMHQGFQKIIEGKGYHEVRQLVKVRGAPGETSRVWPKCMHMCAALQHLTRCED